MKTLLLWLEATRPKTLFASLNPVLLGTFLALKMGFFSCSLFLITLTTALCIQIGTNFVNDYYDFIKGADTPSRKGPRRVVAMGLISPLQIKKAAVTVFLLAALFTLYLTLQGGIYFGIMLMISMMAGIAYTAGPFPLAYLGLGDFFVLIFFGPIATCGTFYLQTHTLSWTSLILGLMPGLFSLAILVVNNLRDQQDDKKVGKKTLAVRFGTKWTQIEYTVAILLGSLISSLLGFYLPLLTLILALIPLKKVWGFKDPVELNLTLEQTGKLGLISTLLLGLNLLLYV
ncbi:MAG: 1,4-dihydroxy-2-naphthoate polyprenyltransferase [Candidatus Rhabdochlamydia sp.]